MKATLYHFCTMAQAENGGLNYSDGTIGFELDLANPENYNKLKDTLAAVMNPPTTRANMILISLRIIKE